MSYRRAIALIGLAVLAGCAVEPEVRDPIQPAERPLASWEGTRLEQLMVASAPIIPELDVGVVLFNPGVNPEATSAAASVRRLESQLLAGALRDTLVSSNQWGAVRMVPGPSLLAPVNISTRIIHSDGRDLLLDVRVIDAMGTEWFGASIAHRQGPEEHNETRSRLRELFNSVSNAMREHWLGLSMPERTRLIAAAEIGYAQQLSPDAFQAYVEVTATGRELKRLPAEGDPMLNRVRRIRNQEILFCDSIDEQYVMLSERVMPTYLLWRAAAVEQAEWLAQYEVRAASRESSGGDGAFAIMQANYAAYRSFRIQEQALVELAEAFEGESAPVVLRTADHVVTLEGSLDAQYETWRSLLREIFALEQEQLVW